MTTTRTYVLILNEVPRSVNAGGGGSRRHHMAAHAEKKRWEGLYALELMANRVQKGMLHCNVAITVRWKHRNHRDLENYRHPIVKPLDALVKCGYLPDDTEEFLAITDLRFEYPETWEHRDPRVKGQLVLALEAKYALVA